MKSAWELRCIERSYAASKMLWRADQALLASKKITDIEICRCLFLKSDSCSFKEARRAFPRFSSLMVAYAMFRASSLGLVAHQNEEYTITDAGRHLVMTHRTGAAAHDLLTEIDAEEAAL